MKKILSLLTVCGLFSLAACQPEDAETVEKDFDFGASVTTVNVGETVTFTDYSINVQSRTWTFPDGEPATSSEPVVDVVFTTQGTKDVTLTVTYSDGTEDKGNISITVLNSLTAEIQADGLTPKGCAKKGQEITFSLDGVVGSPDSYEWTFPGGTPATSSEASPKVVWNDQINDVEVTCKLTRSSDEATATLTKHIIAGNYPMLRADTEYHVDAFGFEEGKANEVWYANGAFPGEAQMDHPEIMSIVDGGANGTAKCMKIDISKIMDGATTFEFAHRNNWICNPQLTVGDKYELIIWFKAENVAAAYWLNIFSWVPDYLKDPLRNLSAAESWGDFFPGQTFEVSGAQNPPVWESGGTFGITIGPGGEYVTTGELFPAEWKAYRWEFTLEEGGEPGDVLRNCYVGIGLSGQGGVVYIDEIQINLIEE